MDMIPTDKLIEMVQNGENLDQYKDCVRHAKTSIRCLLAKSRYFPEYFLNDRAPEVVIRALKAHPEYLPEIINSTKSKHILAVHELLMDKRDATESELLVHIHVLSDKLSHNIHDIGGYSELDERTEMRIKIAAEKVTLTGFEKTMTREQLYETHNVAWAQGLTVREIAGWMLDYSKAHPGMNIWSDWDLAEEQDDWLEPYDEDDENRKDMR